MGISMRRCNSTGTLLVCCCKRPKMWALASPVGCHESRCVKMSRLLGSPWTPGPNQRACRGRQERRSGYRRPLRNKKSLAARRTDQRWHHEHQSTTTHLSHFSIFPSRCKGVHLFVLRPIERAWHRLGVAKDIAPRPLFGGRRHTRIIPLSRAYPRLMHLCVVGSRD